MIEYREACEADASKCVEFMTRIRAERLETVLQHDSIPSIEEEADFIGKHRGKSGVCLLALADGNVVGCLSARIHNHPQLRHSCEFGLGVLSAHRANGIGSQLITRLIGWARIVRLRRIELTVLASNPAIRLYRRLGFEEEGRKRGAIKIGERFEDTIQMALDLSQAEA